MAIWVTKVLSTGLRIAGRGGTHVPGRIALRIQPDLIGQIAHPAQVVAVTGTNGKTTVTNMLADALLLQGQKVATNRIGSNLAAGIAVTLISAVDARGRSRVDSAVLELDERSARLVLPGLDPDVLICTNLTRDSIKRNAHPEYIAWIISSELPARATLVLNADDQFAASLGSADNPRVFFSVGGLPGAGTTPKGAALDGMVCPDCGEILVWDVWRFNHIGRAHCSACDFHSARADVNVRAVDTEAKTLDLEFRGELRTVGLANTNIVNIYNQVAVAAALDVLGFASADIDRALSRIVPPVTRFDEEKIGDTLLVRQLAKSPVGVACSRAFEYVSSLPGTKSILLSIDEWNERNNEVEMVAWAYDADYEYLDDPDITQILVGGVRRYDQALRLMIAGVDPEKIRTFASETEPAERVGLRDADVIVNFHSVHNTVATGTPVQARLQERLRAVSEEGAR